MRGEKLGDTKGVIKPRKLRKDRQCNGQKDRKQKNLQNITQKTKD